jgi:hypothetical protein
VVKDRAKAEDVSRDGRRLSCEALRGGINRRRSSWPGSLRLQFHQTELDELDERTATDEDRVRGKTSVQDPCLVGRLETCGSLHDQVDSFADR